MVFDMEAAISGVHRGPVRVLWWPSFGIRMAFHAGFVVTEIHVILGNHGGAKAQHEHTQHNGYGNRKPPDRLVSFLRHALRNINSKRLVCFDLGQSF